MNRNWILEEFGTRLRQQLLHIYPFEFITGWYFVGKQG